MFGSPDDRGEYHPFHIYSMHQAIEEGFILDVLKYYMTYKTCFQIANSTAENPEVPSSRASKVIRKYQQLHPENIRQKSEVIVETFLTTTRTKINGKAKMMVVTASRPAAVLYFKEIQRYKEEKLAEGEQEYGEIKPMVAFSGEVITVILISFISGTSRVLFQWTVSQGTVLKTVVCMISEKQLFISTFPL